MSTVQSMINPSVLESMPELANKFRGAEPFQHVVIDDFLRREITEAMLADFPSVDDPSTLLNEFGTPNPKSAISDVRSLAPVFLGLDDYIRSDEFLTVMSRITGISDLQYDPWYFGAGTHENFHGAGLDPHFDFNYHPRTRQHRRLNAIIYLNKDWDPQWQGDICFHTDPWDLKSDRIKSVDPIFNRCVIFETTEKSWHSVRPVSLPDDKRHISRKSFTIYLYTNHRPEEETAPDHGTVYVQPGLPDHIRAGRTLTAQDMTDIDSNLHRRQEYLRAMYNREYDFSRTIESLRSEVSRLKFDIAKGRLSSQPKAARSWFRRLKDKSGPQSHRFTSLFDQDWLKMTCPKAATVSLQRFLYDPAFYRVDPHPLFAAAEYLDRNPDVASAGISPLLHYLEHGWLESRDPHPCFANDWYLEQNLDVLSAGANPLEHYLAHGWKEGRRPNPTFDPDVYLNRHPGLKEAGVEPLTHYVIRIDSAVRKAS